MHNSEVCFKILGLDFLKVAIDRKTVSLVVYFSCKKNMAVLGPCASVNMNGHNNIHSQLTKSLERILEDAYLSGELKLSGRKLKEFPKPVKFDLSDTVVAGKF